MANRLRKVTPMRRAIQALDDAIVELKQQRQALAAHLPRSGRRKATGIIREPDGRKYDYIHKRYVDEPQTPKKRKDLPDGSRTTTPVSVPCPNSDPPG
jgi:hypothetical protein